LDVEKEVTAMKRVEDRGGTQTATKGVYSIKQNLNQDQFCLVFLNKGIFEIRGN